MTVNATELHQELMSAVESFKAEHNKQIEELKKGMNDPLQAEKVERINAHIGDLQAALDDMNLKLASIEQGGGASGPRDREYSEAFAMHMKRGEVQAALNKGADAEGGYLTPIEWDRTITSKLAEVSQMRQLARVVSTSKGGFSKLFNTGGTASGWVGESDARPQTNNASFASLDFASGEIYANPAATQQILDDAEINLENWLAEEVQTEFAKQEGSAFVSGDGSKKPYGILTYVEGAANAARHPFGAIGVVQSGAVGEITVNGLFDLVYDLPGAFTGNARFAMNRRTMGVVRKLKDENGVPLWQPSLAAGQPATLCGFPVAELPDMPDVAAGANALLFGDFQQSYLIVDRIGVRVLRDPYTNKPYVSFYTTKRVGGGLLNPEPMRAMQIASE